MYRWKLFQNQQEEPQQIKPIEVTDLEDARKIILASISNGNKALSNIEANQVLRICGFSTPQTTEITDFESTKKAATDIGWPVVLKISSPNIIHKTEIGGVITEIKNEDELKNGWDKLQQIIEKLNQRDVKILIQKDIENGVEIIAGVKKDPTFGPILLFGAGGTLAELIVDKNLKLLPIEYAQAKKLVEKSKIYSILRGFRGGSVYALERLYELIVRLSKLAQSIPEISEIEINPVLVTLNDAYALDGKFIFSGEQKKIVTGPRFKEAAVVSHTMLAGNYHFFVLKPEAPFTYTAGQYISVKVADTRLNSYSIAGHDGENFSVLIDVSPGGPGSLYFKDLKVGEKISFLGPFGIFTLKPEEGNNKILFLGTGSGCSPLKSILESALTEKNYKNEMILYFGLRYQNDVFWQDHFKELAEKYPNFKFKLILSKPNEAWQGQVGHVTEYLKQDFPDTSKCSAYLCGNKQMIEQATEILLLNGCPKEKIYSEKF
jgi:NAD(P)H-flavin reductase